MSDRIIAFGPTHLYRAMQLTISSEQYDTASLIMEAFKTLALPMPRLCCRVV